jgi:hypothetical protein
MSSTRKTSSPGLLRQERFSSAKELRGDYLLANIVTKRCSTLKRAEDRDLVLFIQEFSTRFGCGDFHPQCNQFPSWPLSLPQGFDGETGLPILALALLERLQQPPSAENRLWAADWMARLALDPNNKPFEVSGHREIQAEQAINALIGLQKSIQAVHVRTRVAPTSVASAIWEMLNYAESCKGLVLATGAYRVGKSFAAQAWALSRTHSWRYIQLTSAGDSETWFREIGRALGTSVSLNLKRAELRERVEITLHERRLGLILDEGQNALPSSERSKRVPERLAWILSSLCNRGVPVAILASRDWKRKVSVLRRSSQVWGFEQFDGRCRLAVDLPEALTEADLVAIAKSVAPEADEASTYLLAAAAMKESGYISTIENAVTRARFLASQAGEQLGWDWIVAALKSVAPNFVLPSARAPRAPGGHRANYTRN